MMKDALFFRFLCVGVGSMVGGIARYGVTLIAQWLTARPQTVMGTLTVNVLGCLLIGYLSATPATSRWLSPTLRLLLITGLCGGFTTFSTFVNDGWGLTTSARPLLSLLYIVGSVALGFVALAVGRAMA